MRYHSLVPTSTCKPVGPQFSDNSTPHENRTACGGEPYIVLGYGRFSDFDACTLVYGNTRPSLLPVSKPLFLRERNHVVESDRNLLKITREMEAARVAGGPYAWQRPDTDISPRCASRFVIRGTDLLGALLRTNHKPENGMRPLNGVFASG